MIGIVIIRRLFGNGGDGNGNERGCKRWQNWLELVPLRAELLRMWTEDIPGLEKRLGCSYKAEPMEGMFLHIVEEQLKITECNPMDYCWHILAVNTQK